MGNWSFRPGITESADMYVVIPFGSVTPPACLGIIKNFLFGHSRRSSKKLSNCLRTPTFLPLRAKGVCLRKASSLISPFGKRNGFFTPLRNTSISSHFPYAIGLQINTSVADSFQAEIGRQAQIRPVMPEAEVRGALLAGDTIKAGPMSMKRIYCLYPYENQLYTVKMTGQDIINFLEWGFSNQYETMTHENAPMLKLKRDTKGHIIYREDGRPYLNANPNIYTCAAGISYTVDLTKPEFQRVRIDSFCDGRRFCPKQTYVVALNSYQIGDGGYYISKGLRWDNATLEQHTIPTQNNNIRLYIGKYFQMKK